MSVHAVSENRNGGTPTSYRQRQRHWSVIGFIFFSMLFSLCNFTQAQQLRKIHRIGYLSAQSGSTDLFRLDGFRQALRELGHIEGRNLAIEYRYAGGKQELFPKLMAELVHLKVDVLVTTGSPATYAAQQATKSIPIVMTLVGDPVPKFVASLAKPGGNITGVTHIAPQLSGKRLELLKEAFPNILRVAVFDDATVSSEHGSRNLQETQIAAEGLGIKLQSFVIRRSTPDLQDVFGLAMKQNPDALIVLPGPILSVQRTYIVQLAKTTRLAAIYPHGEFVEAGGLMSYAPNFAELFRRAATYVDKILKGAKPAELPVEQPTKFELVINLKTAKQIGLTIPPNVLARADRVIR
jgi:putative ABC transport system substrate-binding protein